MVGGGGHPPLGHQYVQVRRRAPWAPRPGVL